MPEPILEAVKTTLHSVRATRHLSREDFEDIAQTSLAKTWEKRSKFETELPKYFGRIVKNTVADFLRKRVKEERLRAHSEWFSLLQKEREILNEVCRHEPSKHELDTLIDRLLNDEEKAVLTLRFFEQFTYQEISEILNIHGSTVKRRLVTANGKLRRGLGVASESTLGSRRDNLKTVKNLRIIR